MNDIPKANIRIIDLKQPYYQVNIEFENETLDEIVKYNSVVDVDDIFIDATYRIRRDKNDSPKMKFIYFSESSKSEIYNPKENVHVVHFNDLIVKRSAIETTTTTVVSDNLVVGANISIDAFNMNVSIYDRQLAKISQTTTTTITSHTHSYEGFEPYRYSCERKYEMKSSNFSIALSSVKNQNFDETKLARATEISSANC